MIEIPGTILIRCDNKNCKDLVVCNCDIHKLLNTYTPDDLLDILQKQDVYWVLSSKTGQIYCSYYCMEDCEGVL